MPVLIKIAEYAQDASNKIMSIRQCLNATMIIVLAILIAHFVDRTFYTFRQSSDSADQKVWYFAVALKSGLIIMVTFAFIRIRKVINNDPYVTLNKKLFNIHASALFIYYVLWVLYEISHTLWILDPDYGKMTDNTLIVLAICILTFNLSSIFLNIILFYMMDKIT